MKLILGSGSPRRQSLLSQLGISFSVDSPSVDETPLSGESPIAYVERLAQEKASEVASRHKEALVLSADTIVVHQGKLLGKPRSKEESFTMLRSLSGSVHEVISGVALGGMAHQVFSVISRVSFRKLADTEIEWYWGTGEPADKAGSYGLQGAGGAFVTTVEGSYSNVIGLPLVETVIALQRSGIECLGTTRQ